MKDYHSVISEDFLGRAAFLLLSSSSLNRYINVAKSLAKSSEIQTLLETGIITVEELFSHADYLWRLILKNKQRDLPEIELAILLPIITNLASNQVSEFLIRLSLHDKPTAIWISALARYLFNHRATNQEFSSSGMISPPFTTVKQVELADDHEEYLDEDFIPLLDSSKKYNAQNQNYTLAI